MNSHHLIEEAHVNIAFSSEDEASSQQAVLGDFINGALLNEVDGVFNEYAERDTVLRIERLEIDLGVVPFQGYQEEMVERLKTRLHEQLRDFRHGVRSGDVEKITLIPTAVTEFETVEAILRDSSLPWCGRALSVEEMRRLFMRVVEAQCDGVVRLLENLPGRSVALDRLVEMLPLKGLATVAAHLLRRDLKALSLLLESVVDYHLSGRGTIAINAVTRDGSLREVWKVMIALLLSAVNTRQNAAAAIAALLNHYAAGDAVLFEQMRTYLVEQGQRDLALSNDEQQALEVVVESLRRFEEADESALIENGAVSVEQLTGWVTSGEIAAVKKIASHWQLLLEQYPQQLAKLFRANGRKMALRREWADQFSGEQLSELIGLIDSGVQGFVSSTVTLLGATPLFGKNSQRGDGGREVRQGSRDEKILWDFTLDFIFIERGSRFNKKAYCSALLRDMAAHNNGSYGELLGMVLQWLLSHAEQSTVVVEMLSILGELSSEYAAANGVPLTGSEDILAPPEKTISSSITWSTPLSDDEQLALSIDNSDVLRDMVTTFLVDRNEQRRHYFGRLLNDRQRAYDVVTKVGNVLFERLLSVVIGDRYNNFALYAEPLVESVLCIERGVDEEVLRCEQLLFCCRNLIDAPFIRAESFVLRLADHLAGWAGIAEERRFPEIVSQLKNISITAGDIAAQAADFLKSAFEMKNEAHQLESSSNEQLPLHSQQPLTEQTLSSEKTVYIKNAGQVLLAPYLPTLFSRMGVIKDGRFIDAEASARAIVALQYLVDGVGEVPEYMMVLNKLLCGVESSRPPIERVRLSEEEKGLIDGLLLAAIENWTAIGATSINGFRGSFLQREGKLTFEDEQWNLLVETRSFDMLLDRLPWSYATVKYSWMPHVINVEWR